MYQEYHDFTEEEIWTFRNSSWQIIPINFQKRHRQMLQWTYTLMSKRFMKIRPSLQELIVSLRTAVVLDDWKLDPQVQRARKGEISLSTIARGLGS